jgi:hypothetical protein
MPFRKPYSRSARFTGTALLLLAGPAHSAEANLPLIGSQLLSLLVVVIVVESAMAAIFHWRVFRTLFGHHALRTPVMVAVGLLIVTQLKFDAFGDIAVASGIAANDAKGTLTTILSALVIAGGSSGINTIFQKLGIRSPLPSASEEPKLDQSQAWLAIQVFRNAAVGDVKIALRQTDAPAVAPIVGIATDRDFKRRWRDAWGLSTLRFPRAGGKLVEAGKTYEISLIYSTGTGEPETAHPAWTGSFAPRAVVDLELTA